MPVMKSIRQGIRSLLNNKTIKNGGLFAFFSFFSRGVSFILLTILAKYISPEDYGELSLFNTLVTLLGYFVGSTTAGYMSISFFKGNKDRFKEDFTAINLITVVSCVIILLFLLMSSQWLSGVLKVSVKFLFLGLLIAFTNVFVRLNLDYFRVQEKLSSYGLLSCSFTLLNFVIAIYLVIDRKLNWHGQVYALVICNLIYAVVAIVCFCKNQLFRIPKLWETYKKIIIWGLPIIPHLASGWIKQGLDRYIIEGTHTMSDVGLFSFALTLSSMIIMVGLAFNQTNSVSLYQTLSSADTNENKRNSLHRKERFLTFFYLGIVVFIMAMGSILIPIVMPKYARCVPYFLILSVYGFFQCIYFLYCNYLFYFNSTKQLMIITLGTSMLHFVLSLGLTRYSLYLTCLIYVISILVVVLLVYIQSKKLCNEHLS